MPIVAAICPTCGGQLEVDNGKEAGICKFCGNAFITETAVNNYHIKYEIKADTIVMNNKTSMEDLLDREEVYRKISDTEHLEQVYEDMTQLYPKRHEGWWGKILMFTNDLADLGADISQIETWYGLVTENAPKDALKAIDKQYHGYILRRMKKELAEKEIMLQQADEEDKSEQESYLSGIRIKEKEASDYVFKSALLAALGFVLVIIMVKCGSVVANDENAPDECVWGIILTFGAIIAIVVKLYQSDWLSDALHAPTAVNWLREEFEEYKKKYAEQRRQAVENIDTLRKDIDNYTEAHGLGT